MGKLEFQNDFEPFPSHSYMNQNLELSQTFHNERTLHIESKTVKVGDRPRGH